MQIHIHEDVHFVLCGDTFAIIDVDGLKSKTASCSFVRIDFSGPNYLSCVFPFLGGLMQQMIAGLTLEMRNSWQAASDLKDLVVPAVHPSLRYIKLIDKNGTDFKQK